MANPCCADIYVHISFDVNRVDGEEEDLAGRVSGQRVRPESDVEGYFCVMDNLMGGRAVGESPGGDAGWRSGCG